MNDYKKISRTVRMAYVGVSAVILMFVVLTELNVFPVEGMLVGIGLENLYILEVGMFFVVAVGLLAVFKGFNWMLRYRVYVVQGKLRTDRYIRFCNIRVGIFLFFVLLGMFLYYATLANWGLYYALAALVLSFSALPTADKVEEELAIENMN